MKEETTTEQVQILPEFAELGLSELTLNALKDKGFETPSPIQKLTIPALLADDSDIIAQAQTGTGKTAAFGLPIVELLQPDSYVQALVLVPTRELAIQVTDEIQSFRRRDLRVTPIYGGAAMNEQLRRLNKGVDIVVGTPGRILDHLRRGTLDLSHIRWVVLDEADEMLNMGFIDDVDEILSHANDQRRILLFSATMPSRVSDLSTKYMQNVQHLKVANKQLSSDLTDQIYFEVRESDKFDALTRIIDVEPDFYAIVFCRTKVAVDMLMGALIERGYATEALHGDVSQAMREKIINKFRRRQINILIATDVAARGIDISNLTHVINYSLPQDPESYVHRIGRTGRAGQEGMAITFISPSEYRAFTAMQRQVKVSIRKEELPTAADIVEMKRQKILDDLVEVISEQDYVDYVEMAEALMAQNEGDAKIVLASLLKMAFKNELNESSYPEIRRIDVDRRGKARLFIGLGKNEGYRPKMIVDLLKAECGIADQKIDDVRCMDDFSFVTVPFGDAEGVLKCLNSLKSLAPQDDRPLATMAKEEHKSSDRSDDSDLSSAISRADRAGSGGRGGFGGGGGPRRSGGGGGGDRRSGGYDRSGGGDRRSGGGGDRRSSGGGGGGYDRGPRRPGGRGR